MCFEKQRDNDNQKTNDVPFSMIKAFFFDIGGVLVRVDSSRAIKKLSKLLNVSEKQIREAMSQKLLDDYEKGKLSSNQFYNNLLKNCDSDKILDLETFKTYWQDVLFPMEESIAFLQKVVAHYPVWFLSNTNEFHYDILQKKFAFMAWSKGGTYSFLSGSVKPEPQIYHAAIQASGFKPDEILFIDDLEKNVEAARRESIHSIQFKSFNEFSADLQSQFPELGFLL